MEEVRFDNASKQRDLMLTHSNKILELSLQIKHKVVNNDIDETLIQLGEMIATCRSLVAIYEDEKVFRVQNQLRNEVTKEEFFRL